MKHKRIFRLFAVMTAALMLCTGCGGQKQPPQQTQDNEPPKTSEPPVQQDVETAPQSAMYMVESCVQLKRLTGLANGDTVLMKGYYIAGDGGGGLFFWDADSTATPDGGTVIAANGVQTGRFLRDCEPNYRNVKWFGAVGSATSDDTAALQAAIDSLPASGGTVWLPGGVYKVTKPVQIGNGDGADRHSTVNGIKLIGEGAGFAAQGAQTPTRIQAGVEMDTIISVNGKISDVVIQDMFISGNYLSQTGITIHAASGLTVRDIFMGTFIKYGIKLIGGSGVGTENKFNRFETVSVYAVNPETVCVWMDGERTDTAGNQMTTFIDCRFDTAQTENSYAIWIRNTTGADFYRCHFNTYKSSSTGLILDGTNCDGYPYGNVFYDCSIVSTKVIEDTTGYIGHNFFYGFGTYDNEIIPTHPMLSGITDIGTTFNLG